MRALPEAHRSMHVLRHAFAARDYSETVNFSFVDAEWERDLAGNDNPVRVINPIASQLAVMRSSLFGSLISVLRYNLNRRAERIRLFEVGRVFRRDSTVVASESTVAGYAQPVMFGALAYGPAVDEQWGVAAHTVDYFDVKGDLEALLAPAVARFVKAEHPALHPGRSARIELDGEPVGWIGELHPRWLRQYDLPLAPVVFEIAASALAASRLPGATDVPRFPPVRRDIAFVVDQAIEAQALLDELEKARADDACKAVQRIVLFDEFRPGPDVSGGLAPHQKSLAFRVTLQDTGGTLQDEKVDLAIKILVERLARVYGARLRG
jgi:phenylalanyl-tRNA synthetase beta chain